MFQTRKKIVGWEDLEGIFLPPRPFYPPEKDVYRALELTPLDATKVVIIGQDPYHQMGVADGLAFSSRLSQTPRSLFEIYKELNRTHGIQRKTNSLEDLAKKGVLLLNRALTVAPERPRSHLELWDGFFLDTLRLLRKCPRSRVIVLVGKEVATFNNEWLLDPTKDVILEVGHPSPVNRVNPFYNSGIFLAIDKALEGLGYSKIEWGD